jgi:hypothetical protein
VGGPIGLFGTFRQPTFRLVPPWTSRLLLAHVALGTAEIRPKLSHRAIEIRDIAADARRHYTSFTAANTNSASSR